MTSTRAIAVVVDPAYAIEQYLDAASATSVELVGVLETHTHADHVSGHGRLALEHGVPVHVHALPTRRSRTSRSPTATEIELGDVVAPHDPHARATGRSTARSP